jgi:hypothetical protein
MCGIVGILARNTALDPDLLHDATNRWRTVARMTPAQSFCAAKGRAGLLSYLSFGFIYEPITAKKTSARYAPVII